MPNILLSTVCRPFGGPGEGDSVGAELFHAQITRAQGIFSFRQVIRCWGLDYIAENIDSPCVVLHYPSEREFIQELNKRAYAFIGINFVVATFHKVEKMVTLIRQYSPDARIILGGYGTVLPDTVLAPCADHVCREEGIGFMRRLLNEQMNEPIRHPYVPILSPTMYSYQLKTKVAHITAGLGCPNGCDFCCTSHFFNRKYVPLVGTGSELYTLIVEKEREAEQAGDVLSGFIIIDEDFFINRKRALEFLACVRENGKVFQLMGFGSVKGISQFTADEIAEMGFDTIWTAYEGEQSGYSKLNGKPLHELYISLKSRGITLLSSMIIGFPYQDHDQVLSEFEALLKLEPSFTQILIYFAFPGTPFHERLLNENNYLPEYLENPDLRRWDGFALHFRHPYFQASELETLQKELYRLEFESLGPSLIRVLTVWFDGYKNLRHSSNPVLRKRAERFRQYIKDSLPGMYPAIYLGPTQQTRQLAKNLLREITNELGSVTVKQKCMGIVSIMLAIWTRIALHLNIFQQPVLHRLEHRFSTKANALPDSVNPLQGFYSSPVFTFYTDMVNNIKNITRKLIHGNNRRPGKINALYITRPPEKKLDFLNK